MALNVECIKQKTLYSIFKPLFWGALDHPSIVACSNLPPYAEDEKKHFDVMGIKPIKLIGTAASQAIYRAHIFKAQPQPGSIAHRLKR